MDKETSLDIDYYAHDGVRELIDFVRYCFEGLSLAFDRYDEDFVKGPGLYLAIVSGCSVTSYADPMGENRWPVDACRQVSPPTEAFYEAASEVAKDRDGAVVVSADGTVQEQMVRFRDLSDAAPADDYADWMGSRHMSALDTSARQEVVAALTLSEESGRVTLFHAGTFDTTERQDLGGRWCADEHD